MRAPQSEQKTGARSCYQRCISFTSILELLSVLRLRQTYLGSTSHDTDEPQSDPKFRFKTCRSTGSVVCDKRG